ncbi:MAG: hypothetical protein MUP55_02845 [Candidatus Aenigmarchaeota archaeon]|nr:hypothetical protein [Candidatus Aenigmarchaeota archaeon]
MKKKSSFVAKVIGVGEWLMIIGFVFGVIAIFVIGAWMALNWLMEQTLGISMVELSSRAGIIGNIAVILGALVMLGLVATVVYNIIPPCTDMV